MLDLEMPRMDGFEFLERYAEEYAKENRSPILVYSGKDITDVQEKLLNERVVGFVKKDETSMEELSDRISKLIKAS